MTESTGEILESLPSERWEEAITITIKILLLQLDASHETARRHPSSPRRKLKICPTPKVANKLPCGRSWQGATAPAARHKT